MADNIRTFTNPFDAPKPDDRGAQALDRAGEAAARTGAAWDDAFSSIGNELGGTISRVGEAYVRQLTANETAKASAKLATTHAELSTEWNQIAASADPNEIDKVADEFREKRVRPALSAIGDELSTVEGQNFFTKAEAEITSNLFEKTASDVAALNGVAAVNNAITVRNKISQTAFKDPSSFGAGTALSHLAIDAMVEAHKLPREKAIELNAQSDHLYATSAAMGMIDKNPTAAKKDIADGRFDSYLDAKEIQQLVSHAETMEKAQTEQQKAAATELRRQQKEAFTGKVNEIMAQTVRPDGSLTLPPDYFQNVMRLRLMPEADDGTLRAAFDFGRSVQNDIEKGTPVVTDPHTYEDFRDRAFLPDSSPNALTSAEVIQARADRKLSNEDFRFWSGAVNEMRKDENQSNAQKDFNRFLNGYKGYITSSSFLSIDAQGDQKFYEWSSWAQRTRDQLLGQKMSEDDIRKRLIAEIPRYQVTREQGIAGTRQQATGNLTPLPQGPAALVRKPGETAQQFLKRMSGQ